MVSISSTARPPRIFERGPRGTLAATGRARLGRVSPRPAPPPASPHILPPILSRLYDISVRRSRHPMLNNYIDGAVDAVTVRRRREKFRMPRRLVALFPSRPQKKNKPSGSLSAAVSSPLSPLSLLSTGRPHRGHRAPVRRVGAGPEWRGGGALRGGADGERKRRIKKKKQARALNPTSPLSHFSLPFPLLFSGPPRNPGLRRAGRCGGRPAVLPAETPIPGDQPEAAAGR